MTSSEQSTDPSSLGGESSSPFGKCIGVIATEDLEHTCELLGDAAELAARLKTPVCVLAFGAAANAEQIADELFRAGADEVEVANLEPTGSGFTNLQARLKIAQEWRHNVEPRLTFVGGSGASRTFAATLAARCCCELFSPALSASARGAELQIMALHPDGRRAQQVTLPANRSAIVVLSKGVGQARPVDKSRSGTLQRLEIEPPSEPILTADFLPADPATTDIQHLPRLVAGGNGVGGREGFKLLQSVAQRLGAGVAASRMAVDQGWIDRERQVGQSGKTVRPELYIACGISGASHHLEGMSTSRHIVAINRDPQAPIFRSAHLGLVADWRETMVKLDEALAVRQDLS